MFRLERQSNEDARSHWPLLDRLAQGIVYAIDNSHPGTSEAAPVPAFKVVVSALD